MLHTLHLFIDKGFTSLLESVGKTYLSQYPEALKYNYFYNVSDEKGKLVFEKVLLQEYNCDNVVPELMPTLIGEKAVVKQEDLMIHWSEQIFDSILKVGTAENDTLYVFLHLPLYRKDCFGIASELCSVILKSGRPVNIDFVGYCEDMSKFIEPDGKYQPYSAQESLSSIKQLYSSVGLSYHQNRFVMIQNRSIKGVAILSEDDGSTPCYDMVANLTLLLSSHYDSIFSIADADPRELVGLGFSSLSFDKYLFASYMLRKAMLKAIDIPNVNNNDVDVNRANGIACEILKNKDSVLSRFLETWKGKEKEGPQYENIKSEIENILDCAMDRFRSEKDVTAKTAVLAALLSKTECELFSGTFYNPENTTFDDLYSEAVDYYILEDTVGYYRLEGAAPVNPLKELKNVNRKLIQSEVTVRTLAEQMKVYEEQIEKNDKVKECFIDDGVFTIGENKFKMLPSVDEVPLEETYSAHEVKVDSVDLRKNFSRIKNQGQQGSCLAFTLTSVFEYMMKQNKKDDCDLSEAFLYYNARNLDSDGSVNEDNGSRFVPSLESLRTYGIALEKAWPYNDAIYDQKPSQEAYDDAATRKLVKALNVERNVDAIKSALVDGFPVACSFTLFESFSTAGAYIPMPTDEEIASLDDKSEDAEWRHSRHAMVIVGFSDKLQRFLVRNSWGVDWGDQGYCYIPYSYVAHSKLFNFACIISEVASLTTYIPELKEVPALEINNSDVKIRYYVAAAAYDLQLQMVRDLRKRKEELIQYFEVLKSMYAEPNMREEFIDESLKAIERQNAEHNTEIKNATKVQDEVFETFKGKRKRQIIRVALVLIGTLGLYFLWNILWNSVEALQAKYFWLLICWGGYAVLEYILFKKYYDEWREERDHQQSIIDRNKKKIAENNKRSALFRHKTTAAWMTITSLSSVYPKLESMYSKIVNLVNNLRLWYKETSQEADDETFTSIFPNISLLDRDRLDTFFASDIADSGVCEVDLCEDIENYQTTSEYLFQYKANLKAKLKARLFEKLSKMSFNMTDHLVSGKFSNILKDINESVISDWERQAGLFIHIQSPERAVVTTDNQVYAYNLNAHRSKILNKLSTLHASSYQEVDDPFRVTLVRVAPLSFNECVVFQGTPKTK